MHILKIPPYAVYSRARPWLGGFQRDQAKALQEVGERVGFLVVDLYQPQEWLRYRKSEEWGARVEIIDSFPCALFSGVNPFPKLAKLKSSYYVRIGLSMFENYLKTFGRPDIVHCHNTYYSGFLALAIKEKFDIPYVLTEHNSAFPRNIIPKSLHHSINKVINQSSSLITVSPALGESMENLLKEKVDYNFIPNILGPLFQEVLPSISKSDKFRFINVASLDKNKNHNLLLNSFARTFKGEDVELLIIGQGKLKSSLVDKCHQLGIDRQVTFLGQLAPERVREEMLSSHAFVLSSSFETFGVAIIEALACGLPSIATKCGGPEYILNKENGVLVKKDSEEDFAKAMIKLVSDYANYDKVSIRDQCLADYGNKAFVSKISQVYKKAFK